MLHDIIYYTIASRLAEWLPILSWPFSRYNNNNNNNNDNNNNNNNDNNNKQEIRIMQTNIHQPFPFFLCAVYPVFLLLHQTACHETPAIPSYLDNALKIWPSI